MRSVYAHFPINCVTSEANSVIEIRNFLGEKYVRKIIMRPGVTVENSKNKDELLIQGNDLEEVSLSGRCKSLHQGNAWSKHTIAKIIICLLS